MKKELTKLSAPGWEKTFCTELEAYIELQHYICDMCLAEHFDEFGAYPEDIHDLLNTACGCEFMLEEV